MWRRLVSTEDKIYLTVIGVVLLGLVGLGTYVVLDCYRPFRGWGPQPITIPDTMFTFQNRELSDLKIGESAYAWYYVLSVDLENGLWLCTIYDAHDYCQPGLIKVTKIKDGWEVVVPEGLTVEPIENDRAYLMRSTISDPVLKVTVKEKYCQ